MKIRRATDIKNFIDITTASTPKVLISKNQLVAKEDSI